MRDPVLQLTSFVRALGGSIPPTNQLEWELGRTGEAPLMPPSVFGIYSQLFRVPHTALAGPEFHIYSPTEAVLRGNLMVRAMTNPGGDFTLDITPFTAAAGNIVALIDKVDQTLLYGRMPATMRQSLATAIATQLDTRERALTALILTALSGLHAVQH